MQFLSILLLLAGGLVACAEAASRDIIYCFDFGGDYQEVAVGFTPVSRVYRSPKYLWIDNVSEEERIEEPDPLLRDFVGGSKGEFFILSGPPGKSAQPLFEQAPHDFLPSTGQVLREGAADARVALRQLCDWLLGHRLPNGFLGDYEPGAKSVSYYWYTSAYPIRTLLAGYQIFGEKKYLDAVLQILDKLVEEQMPNGAWQQTYRNKPTRDLSKAELEEIMQRHWMNLADIGSIVTALAISSRYAPPPRKENYIAAVRRYCDEWASRWQLPSGGFTNGMESGVSQTEVYSVATGTEAAAFAALYAVTKEEKYLEKAQRAAEFLIDNWRTDGQPVCYPHHSQNEGKMYVQPVTQFGDIFYYHDGILLVYYHSQDQNFRRKVEKAYGWYTKGERGLLSSIGQNPWWPLQDYWDNSKTAGIPLALLGYQRMGTDVAVDRAVNITKRFLCTPKFSRRIGVMVEDPPLPWGGHTLQCSHRLCRTEPRRDGSTGNHLPHTNQIAGL